MKSAAFFAALTLLLCLAGFYLASSEPDGLEKIAERLGFPGSERTLIAAPLADYRFPWLASPAGSRAAAGLLGAGVCFLAAFAIGRYSGRKERTRASGPDRSLE